MIYKNKSRYCVENSPSYGFGRDLGSGDGSGFFPCFGSGNGYSSRYGFG